MLYSWTAETLGRIRNLHNELCASRVHIVIAINKVLSVYLKTYNLNLRDIFSLLIFKISLWTGCFCQKKSLLITCFYKLEFQKLNTMQEKLSSEIYHTFHVSGI